MDREIQEERRTSCSVKLPLYKCFKNVRAAKIIDIKPPTVDQPALYTLLLTEPETEVVVSAEWMQRTGAKAGGYYVVYEDGYVSFSPAKAFEEGYIIFKPPVSDVEGDEIIDRKFEFVAVNPITHRSYSQMNALVFVAKDAALPAAIEAYIKECSALGANAEHLQSMRLALKRVIKFQSDVKCRVPDTVGEEIARCVEGEGL